MDLACYVSVKGEMSRKKRRRRKGMERVAGEEEKRKISEAISLSVLGYR